jgi:hypothetical protein
MLTNKYRPYASTVHLQCMCVHCALVCRVWHQILLKLSSNYFRALPPRHPPPPSILQVQLKLGCIRFAILKQ